MWRYTSARVQIATVCQIIAIIARSLILKWILASQCAPVLVCHIDTRAHAGRRYKELVYSPTKGRLYSKHVLAASSCKGATYSVGEIQLFTRLVFYYFPIEVDSTWQANMAGKPQFPMEMNSCAFYLSAWNIWKCVAAHFAMHKGAGKAMHLCRRI